MAKRPPCGSKGSPTDLDDRIIDRLERAVSSRRLVARVGDGHAAIVLRVTAVSLMTPKRVPREIDRRQVVRIGDQLGAGAMACVFKATLTEKSGRSASYLIASKEVREGANATRADFEKEAALMALLEHAHVVALVGVVTVPQNMPLLLLLEYCENGSLDAYLLRAAEDEPVSMSLKLSFCSDVANGMCYLASRRVVHRDLAARNVLLDSALAAKVADFGMSVLCRSGGRKSGHGEYNEYVRLCGRQPVRWCSVEVLDETRWSSASDVWAYGVFVYEVISNGGLPYEELCPDGADLNLVASHVRGGGTLARPDQCPRDVYARLMVPCWDPDPSARPLFSELADASHSLGGVASDYSHAQGLRGRNNRDNLADDGRFPPAFWTTPEGRGLLGVSVHHLGATLLPAAIAATRQPFADAGGIVAPPHVLCLTIAHSVAAVVKPRCRALVCPRDGEVGCAYVVPDPSACTALRVCTTCHVCTAT